MTKKTSHASKIAKSIHNISVNSIREWELITGVKLHKKYRAYLISIMEVNMMEAYSIGKGY